MRSYLISGGRPGSVAESAASKRRMTDRLLWLCPGLSLIFAAGLLWLVGLTPWAAVLAAVLIGCPVAVVFALLAERLERKKRA